MGNIFSTIKGSMASEPKYAYNFAIITERNGVPKATWVTKQDAYIWPRPTACDTIVCRIFKMASNNRRWSGTQITEYCSPSTWSKTGLCVKLYTCSLGRQWAIPTSTVKSNYFRFATITLNFTHNELSNIVDFKLSVGWTLTSGGFRGGSSRLRPPPSATDWRR